MYVVSFKLGVEFTTSELNNNTKRTQNQCTYTVDSKSLNNNSI